MKPTALHTVFFSPTGTSQKIAAAITRGIASCFPADIPTSGPQRMQAAAEAQDSAPDRSQTAVESPLPTGRIDLTHVVASAAALPADTVAVFAVPVYGGHVAPTALERMRELRGEGTPAVITVVYGNRAFEGALRELAAFVAGRGFVPVAAAAFVGEHSYSTPALPIAASRPDAADLGQAEAFGRAVARKLIGGKATPVDAALVKEPPTPLLSKLRFIRFVLAYRRRQKRHPAPLLPAGDADLCTHCGRCVKACPTQAIVPGDEPKTDPARCIRCNACVKTCPTGSRTYPTPFAAALARNFAQRKPPVTRL